MGERRLQAEPVVRAGLGRAGAQGSLLLRDLWRGAREDLPEVEIPVPGRGYWARKAAGQDPPRTPLPPLKRGQPSQHCSARYREPNAAGTLGGDAAERIERERDPANRIVVPDTLAEPHPLVRMSAPILRRSPFGERSADAERCLDIVATGPALNRALRVADALIKALEARGYEIEISEPQNPDPLPRYSYERKPSRTLIRMGESSVAFSIEEQTDTFEPPPVPRGSYRHRPRYERRPNGRLALLISDRAYTRERQRWCDGKKQRIEKHLNDFVAALIATAENLRVKAIEAEKERQRRIAAEREHEAATRQKAAMALVARDLHRRMNAWRTAQDTRAFVDLLKRWAGEDGATSDPQFADWLHVAEWRIESLEQRARARLLDRKHKLPYGSPLQRRFGWRNAPSTSEIVAVMMDPYREEPEGPDDASP